MNKDIRKRLLEETKALNKCWGVLNNTELEKFLFKNFSLELKDYIHRIVLEKIEQYVDWSLVDGYSNVYKEYIPYDKKVESEFFIRNNYYGLLGDSEFFAKKLNGKIDVPLFDLYVELEYLPDENNTKISIGSICPSVTANDDSPFNPFYSFTISLESMVKYKKKNFYTRSLMPVFEYDDIHQIIVDSKDIIISIYEFSICVSLGEFTIDEVKKYVNGEDGINTVEELRAIKKSIQMENKEKERISKESEVEENDGSSTKRTRRYNPTAEEDEPEDGII